MSSPPRGGETDGVKTAPTVPQWCSTTSSPGRFFFREKRPGDGVVVFYCAWPVDAQSSSRRIRVPPQSRTPAVDVR